MRIYLDVCCLNRPFDSQVQERIRIETEAVSIVLDFCERGIHNWVSSSAVEEEAGRNPDVERRLKIQDMLVFARERLTVDEGVVHAARSYRSQGLGWWDALHVALAEHGGCDVLLSVDDELVRRAKRLTPPLRVTVTNPALWVMEVS